MKDILMLLSGICWSLVYIEVIRLGFKNHTYGVPLFALGLNFAWELINAYVSLLVPTSTAYNPLQGTVNLVWAMLDAVIVVTYFKYGKKYFYKSAQIHFVSFSVLVFISCVVIQLAFLLQFGGIKAAEYSAFAQNVAMSVLFLTMLYQRNSTVGQSRVIAVAKWIGTLAPTILTGFLEGPNVYVILMGTLCTVFDVIYIAAIWRWDKSDATEKRVAFSPEKDS